MTRRAKSERSIARPQTMLSDVAVDAISEGNCHGAIFTFKPIPMIVARRLTGSTLPDATLTEVGTGRVRDKSSTSTPHTFLPAIRTSLGHLIRAASPNQSLRTSATATAAKQV